MSRRVGLNIVVLVGVIAVVAAVAIVRSQGRAGAVAPRSVAEPRDLAPGPAENDAPVPTSGPKAEIVPGPPVLPRLVDLGASQCIPCRMMAPILEQVRAEYAGRVGVEVIDVREDREAARRYGIRVIPTQIFYDAAGREVWRHEGFLPKQAIVGQLQQMGISP